MADLDIAFSRGQSPLSGNVQQFFEHMESFEIVSAFVSADGVIFTIDKTWDLVLMGIIMPSIGQLTPDICWNHVIATWQQ